MLLLLLSFPGFPQVAPDKYLVEFTDKNNSPYSTGNPAAYLSPRAIERRARFGIPVTEQDFPVNPSYIQAVRATGVMYLQSTKWLNAIVIKTTDTNALAEIGKLPFVKKVARDRALGAAAPDLPAGLPYRPGAFVESSAPVSFTRESGTSGFDYGAAFSQISMLGGTVLHERGFRGQGMRIAVLDGGFTGAQQMDVFDSLRQDNRLKGTLNLVGGGSYVYQGTSHGSAVLSIMAADKPGFMIGTSPMAEYLLVRSEDVNSEYIVEEYNWATGAEYADSAGADLISSSLSYRYFINSATSHTYQQTNGHTAPITIAAATACNKGMIVVVSAGNSGQEWEWPYIGFPADGDSVFTVGAVDAHGIYAPFSSTGPTIDKRIKPEVAARGVGTITALPGGVLAASDGTSYSTPLIAGLAACLWQAFPDRPGMKILDGIRQSGSQATSPDTLLGWGVPDFAKAFQILLSVPGGTDRPEKPVIYPDPFEDRFSVMLPADAGSFVRLELLDAEGTLLYRAEMPAVPSRPLTVIPGKNLLPAGLYILKITGNNHTYIEKIIRK